MQDIMINAAVMTAPFNCTLFKAVGLAKARFDTGTPIIEDPLGTKLSYKKLIVGAQVLGAKIAPLSAPGEAVGVLLPNSAGVAVTFFALQTTGRVAAMLNFTSGAANLISACKAAQIKTVLTSRVFIEKGRLGDIIAALSPVVKIVYLDDVRPTITTKDKIAGLLQGAKPQVARTPDDPAAILFTSGSEGTPKGVVLSHRNLLSNCHQVLARMDVNGEDKVFNALPVFHSFGLTAGCIMPVVGGIPVHLYPTPLHSPTRPIARSCLAPTRSSTATRGRPTPMIWPRSAWSWRAPKRSRIAPGPSTWRSSASASWKATASRKPPPWSRSIRRWPTARAPSAACRR
jgi:acyl-[acyl-carrier-protein]-phospholipid O-acyltransferase / long-chain-fatty-acid--[acyl-carrier-protein] ligase